MSWITKSLLVLITTVISNTNSTKSNPQSQYEYSYNPYIKQYTRNITLKQGVLQGVVLEPKFNRVPRLVEVYRGIPYAAPPIGKLRFMPTGGAPSWFGVKYAESFGPVCPQRFPDEKNMSHFRKNYFLKLKEYLQNESEDCLYLNIYAPLQDPEKSSRKYPVMVYIHGESYEWNSGNPYDGSVLAAYGKVIVVTINFRLGILGFLKAGTEQLSKSNFGLVDQIAALLWVNENIAAFGGDPNAVTLFGHGTGAVCASLLMISPMISIGKERLFHRAILMGGTALADWALAGNPGEVTYQVAKALNCQIHDDFAECLRRKRLDEIMSAGAIIPDYKTGFGPIVDSLVVPNDPEKSMIKYNNLFRRFELMYGVSEIESINLLGPVALSQGMLEKERDHELRKYVRSRCEMKPELCLVRTLAEYAQSDFAQNDQDYGDYTGHEPDRASLARDALLDILSDARSVAPIVQTARYHAALNLQSYFYVFTHKTHSKEYIRDKSYNGEELPYVFGVPLDGPKFHFLDSYTDQERLFSEIIMTYFCNFAYTGNPNMPRKNVFDTMGPAYWTQFDVEWPEFDITDERYLQLDIPPQPSQHYRRKEVKYWNEIFPRISENNTFRFSTTKPTKKFPLVFLHPKRPTAKSPPPWIIDHVTRKTTLTDEFENFVKPYKKTQTPVFGSVVETGADRPDNMIETIYGTMLNSPPKEVKQSSLTNVVTVVGSLFLMANVILFMILYFKCYRNKKKNTTKVEDATVATDEEKKLKDDETFLINGCNIVRMMSKSSKSDETYEAVRPESSSNYKLSRQLSGSTIDAHTKVREWITQEIIQKYSPKFFRRPGQANNTKGKVTVPEDFLGPIETDKNSTLGRSPTRPVSPVEEKIIAPPMKTSTVTRPKIKVAKVSVAVDATPAGRGPSVLMQQPIELTKSLDYTNLKPDTEVPLRRSITLEDFSPRIFDTTEHLRKSTTNINYPETKPTIIKIEHSHSKSDPVQDLNYGAMRKLKTFDPSFDINVTSKDEPGTNPVPLTPEESLMTIKRRNFPKVLPDLPGREILINKRRSMPAHGLFLPIPESLSFSQPNSPGTQSFTKLPPTPPPRTSTLVKQCSNSLPVYISAPILAEEPKMEPEIMFNHLHVGPLIPKTKSENKVRELDNQPIYASLRNLKETEDSVNNVKAASAANLRRADPKIIVRPTLTKKSSDDKSNKHIPRVVVPDNQPQMYNSQKSESGKCKTEQPEKCDESSKEIKALEKTETASGQSTKHLKDVKKSHIPTLVKTSNSNTNKASSSSESTPSEESDTGTVVKKV